MLTHLDLFSGIGGFALAAGWAGYETVMFCEVDPFCRRVLRKHWPDVRIVNDIRTLTGRTVGQPIDLLTGGFPCQPFSATGERRGEEDDRHLWPEMVRVIDEVRPKWVLGENVTGIISMALDDCCTDLEGLGYETWALVLPACSVGAWHYRRRVWILGHANEQRLEGWEERFRSARKGLVGPTSCQSTPADPACELRNGDWRTWHWCSESTDRDWWQLESQVRGVPDGVSAGVVGRVERLKALGNAVVPQLVYEIIRPMQDIS